MLYILTSVACVQNRLFVTEGAGLFAHDIKSRLLMVDMQKQQVVAPLMIARGAAKFISANNMLKCAK